MAYPRNETALTRHIVKSIEARFPDAWVLKTHGDAYQRGGIPDLLIVLNGRVLAVEVKHLKPGESPQALQRRVTVRQRQELEALSRAGASAIVAWTAEQVLAELVIIAELR